MEESGYKKVAQQMDKLEEDLGLLIGEVSTLREVIDGLTGQSGGGESEEHVETVLSCGNKNGFQDTGFGKADIEKNKIYYFADKQYDLETKLREYYNGNCDMVILVSVVASIVDIHSHNLKKKAHF